MAFDLTDLGRNVRKLRESRESRIKSGRSLLQRELAELANIPASSLCNIEKGKYRNPTWSMLSKIAAALDCEITEFFACEDHGFAPSQIALDEMLDHIIKERLEKILRDRDNS